ncbi:MAG: hypothetical protein AAF514_08530 [Verrucomicrobiota bacterium]
MNAFGKYLYGVPFAALVGLLLGKWLFPASVDGNFDSVVVPTNVTPTLLAPADGPSPIREAEILLADVLKSRHSGNPTRAEVEREYRVETMDDHEVEALARKIANGEFAFTTYEIPFVAAVWRRFAAVKPETAYEWACQLPTRDLRRGVIPIAAEAWVAVAPDQALEAFAADAEEAFFMEASPLRTGLQTLLHLNPDKAVKFMELNRGAEWYPRIRQPIYAYWARHDPEAARTWLGNHFNSRPEEVPDLILDLSASDPAEAFAIAMTMEPTPELRMTVAEILGSRWSRMDAAAASRAFEELPTEWHSAYLANSSGLNRTSRLTDPEIEKMASRFPNEDLKARFWGGVVGRRAVDGKFTEAAALLEKLPDQEEMTGFTAASLAREWSRAAPADASGWIAELKPGLVRDHAINGLTEIIGRLEPEAARQWATTIGDEALRRRVEKRLGNPKVIE